MMSENSEKQLSDLLSAATTTSELEDVALRALHEVKSLQEQLDWYRDRVVWGFYEDATPHFVQGKDGEHEINEPVTATQVRNLYKALHIYERERERFRHSKPELTGAYFLAGGYGEKDDHELPKFVRICPAYGASWEQIYERTERVVSYDGS
jgi:hypothetical protein